MSLDKPVVILANGAFPRHPEPLAALDASGTLICCDGAGDQLREYRERDPDVIVGDLDSISTTLKEEWGDRLVQLPDQDKSDLEKAIEWATSQGAEEITILGGTGLRDDHAFGNLLMLHDDHGLEVTLMTDTGIFTPVRDAREFPSFPGQTVALYPSSTGVQLTTNGLAWPLMDEPLTALHRGTSNKCISDYFEVRVSGGNVVVYRGYAATGMD